MSNNSILVVKGSLKEYAWGKVNGLQNWVDKTDSPQAELWFGDHPSGKSIDKGSLAQSNLINKGKLEFVFNSLFVFPARFTPFFVH